MEYGWENLDDLLDTSVTADLVVEVSGMKKGYAVAVLRWAAEDAQTLMKTTQLKMLEAVVTGNAVGSGW